MTTKASIAKTVGSRHTILPKGYDPYDGSMNLADPQSFNRYSYVQNDPVNFVDPSGLEMIQYPESHNPPVDRWASPFFFADFYVAGRGGDGGTWHSIRAFLDRFGNTPGHTVGHTGGGGPQNPTPPDFVREFYDEYQKKLARCIWSVFGTDADGQPNN
ncbi:MAG: hypothetical protein M3430_05025, partial [Acidobacteriota bacterium]|nr:hypothetical protein [Acidobacteriota bacterium]